MALTPALGGLGDYIAEKWFADAPEDEEDKPPTARPHSAHLSLFLSLSPLSTLFSFFFFFFSRRRRRSSEF